MPYEEVYFQRLDDDSQNNKEKTNTKKKTLNPTFFK